MGKMRDSYDYGVISIGNEPQGQVPPAQRKRKSISVSYGFSLCSFKLAKIKLHLGKKGVIVFDCGWVAFLIKQDSKTTLLNKLFQLVTKQTNLSNSPISKFKPNEQKQKINSFNK